MRPKGRKRQIFLLERGHRPVVSSGNGTGETAVRPGRLVGEMCCGMKGGAAQQTVWSKRFGSAFDEAVETEQEMISDRAEVTSRAEYR